MIVTHLYCILYTLHTLGATPVYIAAEQGHLLAVRMLLFAGAKGDTPRKDGTTPLRAAAENGHADVLELLLALVKVCTSVTTLLWRCVCKSVRV